MNLYHDIIANFTGSLLGTSKDAMTYLMLGVIGGFTGTVIRSIDLNKKEKRDWGLILLEIFVWTVLGGAFALVLDLHPLVSLISGLGSPTLYKLTQKPEVINAVFSGGWKWAWGLILKSAQLQPATPTPTPAPGPGPVAPAQLPEPDTNTKKDEKETETNRDSGVEVR